MSVRLLSALCLVVVGCLLGHNTAVAQDCEVCIGFLGKFIGTLTDAEKKDTALIEQKFKESCSTAKDGNGDVVIVKNIPEVNEKLYLVKHLVEIKPVKLPPNLPLDADPSHCRFTEDAELIYSPDLAVTPDQLEDPEDMATVKPHNKLIAKDCVQRWDRAWEKQFT
ncbi:Armet protein [Trinorchestia longiramus]|nr:Armet protein [Trinorchestia longiramus]